MGRVGNCRLSVEGVQALTECYRQGRWASVTAFCQAAGLPKSIYYNFCDRKKWFERITVQDKLSEFGLDNPNDERYYEYKNSSTQPLTNLPQQHASFIGREMQMVEIKGLLTKTRLLTLTGAGGCGKTRFAMHLGEQLIDRYPDGVWLIELASLTDSALVRHAVATGLNLIEKPGKLLAMTIIEFLRARKLLLVIDNCEHLIHACSQLVKDLLTNCPGVHIVATSRQPLDIRGERLWRVPSLSVPGINKSQTGDMVLASLMEYEAARLFIQRVEENLNTFQLTALNAPFVAEICRHLDGIPLALELAAACARTMTIEEISHRLIDAFRLLTCGDRTASPRQQTLRATLDWSYDLLDEQERSLLRRLSVFSGGWVLGTVEAVCQGDDLNEEQIPELLGQLVNKSLVIFDARDTAKGRYRLLETIRQYGLERLVENEERIVFCRRHADFFLRLAEQAKPHLHGPEQLMWLNRLEIEHDNLHAALDWSVEANDIETGMRLTGGLWYFWEACGHVEEARNWIDIFQRKGTLSSASARAGVYLASGVIANAQGNYTRALADYEESLLLYREMENDWAVSTILGLMSNPVAMSGQRARWNTLINESITICKAMGNKSGLAFALDCLGRYTGQVAGDYVNGATLLEESLTLYRELGDVSAISTLIGELGYFNTFQGEYARAAAHFEEQLALNRQLQRKSGVATSLYHLGNLARYKGDYDHSQVLLEESLQIRRELGERQTIADSLSALGALAEFQCDFPRARTFQEASLALRKEAGFEPDVAISLNRLGILARIEGQNKTAQTYLAQSLAIFRDTDNKPGICNVLHELAILASAMNQAEEAARLFGTVEALRDTMGILLPPNERAGYDLCIAAVRASLDEEIFVGIYEEGRAITWEQAVTSMVEDTATYVNEKQCWRVSYDARAEPA